MKRKILIISAACFLAVAVLISAVFLTREYIVGSDREIYFGMPEFILKLKKGWNCEKEDYGETSPQYSLTYNEHFEDYDHNSVFVFYSDSLISQLDSVTYTYNISTSETREKLFAKVKKDIEGYYKSKPRYSFNVTENSVSAEYSSNGSDGVSVRMVKIGSDIIITATGVS